MASSEIVRENECEVLYTTLTSGFCRRFRQLVDLFIEEYVDERTIRSDKTKLVRSVVKTVYENGYRFLKPDEEGVFAELGIKHVLKKVGHALRDRSPNLDLHLEKNLKTRADLTREGVAFVQYAEAVTGGVDHDEWRCQRYYTTETTVSGRQLWVRPRNYKRPSNPETDEAASSLLKMLSSKTTKRKKKNAPAPPFFPNNKKGMIKKTKEKKAKHRLQKNVATVTIKHLSPKRYMKSINDIVVPTLQSASAELPIGGNWKFFPLPGLKNEIDLGTTLKGWKLKLEPMGFEGESISLDVPL